MFPMTDHHQRPQRRHEADGFTCLHCKLRVPGQAWGTKHRNHCPACLWSRHVDITPGDDSEIALLRLALRPLARPAFPLDDPRMQT
jgi:hypothetical protein